MAPMHSAAGKTVQTESGYLAFLPAPLPPAPAFVLDNEGVLMLTEAESALGKLEGMAKSIPDPDLFVGMYVRREAVLSSRIEDIACTLEEVLEFESGAGSPGHNKEIEQVVNYVRACNDGLRRLDGEKLDRMLLKDMHGILLAGNEKANPGTFRPGQNWVGRKGATVFEAEFVPPPVEHMQLSLMNLDYFVNEYQGPLPPLVSCALAHAQFETIHPFSDGNGRIGRLLIVLMLARMKKLRKPLLYLSLYLLDNKTEYVRLLMEVRSHGNWLQWVKFMLRGVEITAKDAIAATEKLRKLQEEMQALVAGRKRDLELLQVLYRYPLVNAKGVQKHLGISLDTAIQTLARFERLAIVRETTGKRRGRTYRFDRYLDILDAGWTDRRAENAPGTA